MMKYNVIICSFFLVMLSACSDSDNKDKPENIVPNSAPIASDVVFFTNKAAPVQVVLNASDLDNDPLSYKLISQPLHGSVSNLSADTLTYTPNTNFSGIDSFLYTANDGKTNSNNATISITVSDSCDGQISTGDGYRCQIIGNRTTETFSIESPPTGLHIHPVTGTIYWTPMMHQVGEHAVEVLIDHSGTITAETISLTVNPGAEDPQGIYVSIDGSSTGAGTPSAPLLTIQEAVDMLTSDGVPGRTIYVRGGLYIDEHFGETFYDTSNGTPFTRLRNDISLVSINKNKLSGIEGAENTITAYGNEFTHLRTDGVGFDIKEMKYWNIKNLFIEGNAKAIDIEEALLYWWEDGPANLTSGGIATNKCEHIKITNNVIWDFPNAGASNYLSDNIIFSNNIIFDNGWWSTGGVNGYANGFIKTYDTSPGVEDKTKMITTNNVFFANASLVISHVFSRGYATLDIDEGSGALLQNNHFDPVTGEPFFKGAPLVKNNLFVYNGKSAFVMNVIDNVTVTNNSTYLNSFVLDKLGNIPHELRLNTSSSKLVQNNLFHPRAHGQTVSDSSKEYVNFAGNASTPASENNNNIPDTLIELPQVFVDPENSNFTAHESVPQGMGVEPEVLQQMMSKIAEYGIIINEVHAPISDTYLGDIRQSIFDTWPTPEQRPELHHGHDKGPFYLEFKEYNSDGVRELLKYEYAQRCHYPGPPTDTPCS